MEKCTPEMHKNYVLKNRNADQEPLDRNLLLAVIRNHLHPGRVDKANDDI
jgi:hypothetical protein